MHPENSKRGRGVQKYGNAIKTLSYTELSKRPPTKMLIEIWKCNKTHSYMELSKRQKYGKCLSKYGNAIKPALTCLCYYPKNPQLGRDHLPNSFVS